MSLDYCQAGSRVGQPASAPLPWPMQFQGRQWDPDRFTSQFRKRMVSGEQGHLLAPPITLLNALNRLNPGGLLAVVDLPEIKNVTMASESRRSG
jgi:hypothetical protein